MSHHPGRQTTAKQRFVRLLREANLLRTADQFRYWGSVTRHARANRAFRQAEPDFALPPTAVAYDAFSRVDDRWYHDSGRWSAELIHRLMRAHRPHGVLRICEWGCGPARIARHLARLEPAGRLQVFASDYNQRTIRWCQENIPEVTFQLNGLEPPLPFGDAAFDSLFAISVFTHLSGPMHAAWIAELERVLAPGGLLLLTLHGDQFKSKLLPPEVEEYESGRLVVRGRVREGSRMFVAFHPPRFVRERLLAGLDVVRHETGTDPRLAGGQDLWLARKR